MAVKNYATAGAKARTWNRLATLLAKFFAFNYIRYAYRRLAKYFDKVQLSKAISAPSIHFTIAKKPSPVYLLMVKYTYGQQSSLGNTIRVQRTTH